MISFLRLQTVPRRPTDDGAEPAGYRLFIMGVLAGLRQRHGISCNDGQHEDFYFVPDCRRSRMPFTPRRPGSRATLSVKTRASLTIGRNWRLR